MHRLARKYVRGERKFTPEQMEYAEQSGKLERARQRAAEENHKAQEKATKKAEVESELEALRDSRRRIDELRAYPSLVNEYLKELSYLVHGIEAGIRAYTYTEEHEERMREAPRGGPPLAFTVSPKIFRVRTTEEMEELRHAEDRDRAERYKSVYTSLGLTAVAHKDGTLELI